MISSFCKGVGFDWADTSAMRFLVHGRNRFVCFAIGGTGPCASAVDYATPAGYPWLGYNLLPMSSG